MDLDLLESILKTSDAYEFFETFKRYGIDSSTLKLLSEEDLKIIGIDDESIRKKLLKNISRLHIRAERLTSLDVDSDYINQVLYEISNQLTSHQVNFTHILNRNDIIVCGVKMEPAVDCLLNCINDLEKQINEVEKQVFSKPKKKSKSLHFIMFVTSALTVAFCTYKIIKYSKV